MRLAGQRCRRVRPLQGLAEQCERPVEHPEGDEHADADEGNELDQQFGGDRQHQAVLVLGGVDMARAEQDREDRHRNGHVERNVAQHRLHCTAGRPGMHEDRGERGRYRLELKCDVGDRSDDSDQRHGGGDGLRLAVTGGDEVGDRGDVLRFGQAHDARDQRRAKADHQDRAEIDGQEVEAGARGEADGAEEGPGGAVDRQRERIDEVPPAACWAEPAGAVAIARDHEQEADIAEREGDDDPALQHDVSNAPRCSGPDRRKAFRSASLRRQRAILERQAELLPDLNERLGERVDQRVLVVGSGRDPQPLGIPWGRSDS